MSYSVQQTAATNPPLGSDCQSSEAGCKEMAEEAQALSLQWVYGLSNLPRNVVNLSDEHSRSVAYAAAHTAVIYDQRSGTQTFLQVRCAFCTAQQANKCMNSAKLYGMVL